MYYDYDQEQIRKQLKQRYNRRFFLGAHTAVLLVTLFLAWIEPNLTGLTVLVMLPLIPHALQVAYKEYRYWLEHKVEREIHQNHVKEAYSPGKRKHYAEEDMQAATFRLTDDGEIEEVRPSRVRCDEFTENKHQVERKRVERKRRTPEKKRRDDDSDEFDVKKFLKKLKDIID